MPRELLRRHSPAALSPDAQLRTFEDEGEADGEGDPEGNLAASAVLARRRRCASLDGFTLHAATRAGALDPAYTDGTIAVDTRCLSCAG